MLSNFSQTIGAATSGADISSNEHGKCVSKDNIDVKSHESFISFSRGKNTKKPEVIDESIIQSLEIEINSFNPDERFDKMCITKDSNEYLVYGRLFTKTLSKFEKYEKLKLDIELECSQLPSLLGFSSNGDGSEILEIRKFQFHPIPFDKNSITNVPRCKMMRIISQIIDFVNYISNKRCSISLITIDDLFSCCFLDEDYNIYFGDTSFIDTSEKIYKNLLSLGVIIYQLLGGEIIIKDEIIQNLVYHENITEFWRKFISTCMIEKTHISSFYSPFAHINSEKIKVWPITENIKKREFDADECKIETRPVEKMVKFEDLQYSEKFAQEIVDKYQTFKYVPVTLMSDDRFENLKAELAEDGKLIFIDEIREFSIEDAIFQFLVRIEMKHEAILPLKGFTIEDSNLMSFNFYREGNQKFKPINFDNMKKAPDEQRIKWVKQMIEFTMFLIEETNYIMSDFLSFDFVAALDQDDNICFVVLEFLKQCSEIDDRYEKNINGFYQCIQNFIIRDTILPVNIPINVKNILRFNENSFGSFLILKDFFDKYDPNFDYVTDEVSKYLLDYKIEKEIEGHQCNVVVYKRNLISDKKFNRLVLKKYNFVFSEKLKAHLEDFGGEIIEFWTTDKESFILMRYVKANRLKEVIPELEYDQKILVLKHLAKTIKYSKDNPFCNLSVNNVYTDENHNIYLLDTIFHAVDFPPEAKNLSILSAEEKAKVDVYSLGVIIYEMFGGNFSKDREFNFENIPIFIENLIRICCMTSIDRAKIETVIEKLEIYQEPNIEELFQTDLIEVAPYYIEKSDLYVSKISKLESCVTQKSKKRVLYAKRTNVHIFFGVNTMRSYVKALKCRNYFSASGFSFGGRFTTYYFDYINKVFDFSSDEFISLSNELKIDIFKKLFQFTCDVYKLNLIIEIDSTEMTFDQDNQVKFLPSFHFREITDYDMKMTVINYADMMCNAFSENGGGSNCMCPKIPNFIQAIVRKMTSGQIDNYEVFSKVLNVFEGMNTDLRYNFDIDSSQSRGYLENGDEYIIYESKKKPDLVEEFLKVDILMKCSDLYVYSRRENNFVLFFHRKHDENLINDLYRFENFTAAGMKARKKIEGFRIEHEYQGEHYLVQYLSDDNKKLVLKKFNKNNGDVLTDIGYCPKTETWEEGNDMFMLQKFIDVETLEDCIKRGADFIDDKFRLKIMKKTLYFSHYGRCCPHNLCINKENNKVIVVDNTFLNENNYMEFKNQFNAPECDNFPELNRIEVGNMTVYSAGWIAYVLFGQTPEMDPETNRFKPPVIPEYIPKFWRDFISLSTRENPLDRPTKERILYIINKKIDTFDEADFVSLTSKLLNHEDYSIENPIGAGGEAVVYLATNKLTGEKHACKKLKYYLYSMEIKKALLAIEKLNNSIFGIKYLGISISENKAYLHMEYVPNGSLSEIIWLDRKMNPPKWFNMSAKLRIAREIAEGMKSLHEQGIVHQDLKPENVLLDENNSIKICDFSFIPEDCEGTLIFMAPELFNGEDATFKSDVYAYAVTLSFLFGGGEMIVSVKTAAVGGFRPSIAPSTPSSIQSLIRKCWQQNPGDRPSFSDIIDELNRANPDEDDLKIKSMDEFERFDPKKKKGSLTDKFEYEICDITEDADNVEYLVRLHMTIQPYNMLQIHKYCRLDDKIILILEKSERLALDFYLDKRKKVSVPKGEKYISDFISIFELYHKNGFCFGPFSLKRLFFRNNHSSSICFDLFNITGLKRPQDNFESIFVPPEGGDSREGDVYSFACFILKIFDCYEVDSDGVISTNPFKQSKRSQSLIPMKYRKPIMLKCLNKQPKMRPSFELLFQELYPVQYNIISNYLSMTFSRFSTFTIKDFNQDVIVIDGNIGSGTFGNVKHAVNRDTGQEIAIKEYSDVCVNKDDFLLEYVALKAIDHPNIVKILGASQRKEPDQGSRLFMEFAGGGDLRKNMNEPHELFVAHLLQISSAMKYLHQRGIIHFDLKPENILIREDGSAVVADFNTAIHVDVNTQLFKLRGTKNYRAPEIENEEKYSFPADVFSFGLIAAEYYSSNAHDIIREANAKHERPVLDFISDKRMKLMLEFCVDDDPMCRPLFDFICKYIFKQFIVGTSKEKDLEDITRIPRIDEDKLTQLRVIASRGSNEAIVEYGKYLMCENSFSDALNILLKGANEGNTSCQNTVGVLSMTSVVDGLYRPFEMIDKASEKGDKFAMTNLAIKHIFEKKDINEAIMLLERASSLGVSHAGYALGFIYENFDIEGITYEERIKKAINLYREAADDGDAFAQYKYGLCLEEGLVADQFGRDCVYYFRQSAYQRYKKGVKKYCEYLEGERKSYYFSLANQLPGRKFRYIFAEEKIFFDEMVSCYTGMLLGDFSSKDRFNFLKEKIFDNIQ